MLHRTIDAWRIAVGIGLSAGALAVAPLAGRPEDLGELPTVGLPEIEPNISIPEAIFGFLISYAAFRYRKHVGALIFGTVLARRRRQYHRAFRKYESN